jgi:arabinogalactan oligomer/maltooligosaccharide transport system substrate-binding protein
VSRMTRVLAIPLAAALTVTGFIAASPAQAADGIVIWADPAHAPVIQELLPSGYKGTPVTVVTKDPATVRADLAAVRSADAPDVVWGDLAWTAELAGAGSIVPVTMTKKRRAQFSANVLNGSSVGGDRFGLPVQISNLALITNIKLVPQQPTTFKALGDLGLKLVKDKKKVKVPFALPQGEGTSPWTTFPLFSGVGGYLFGKNSDGSLNVADVGLASKALKANAGLIDGWNAAGIIDSSLSADAAKTAFAKGRSPFWMAGPEQLADLLALDFPYRIGALPPIKAGTKAVPLLTIQGFMLTRFAAKHGVEDQARKLVGRFLSKAKSQQALAAASNWYPANTVAAQTVATGGGRIKAIGNAGVGGVPMPNVPQAAALWGPYATAWSASTSGPSATPAKKAFRIAQRAAESALGSGDVPTG